MDSETPATGGGPYMPLFYHPEAIAAAAAGFGFPPAGLPPKWDSLQRVFPGLSGGNAASASGKFIPIHCIVEQAGSNSCRQRALVDGSDSNVQLNTYAIIPSSSLFSEITTTTLLKIGYTTHEAAGAKASLHIKNWKSLTFDTITENPDATVEQILGDLTSVATLRIKLCSKSKGSAIEELKEKLLHFLLDRSQDVLANSGCPLEKLILNQLSKGEAVSSLTDDTRTAFNHWYHKQLPGKSSPPAPADDEATRLRHWFEHNPRPSRGQMIAYLRELNGLPCRRDKPPLELSALAKWFREARGGKADSDDSTGESNETVPVLPNSNAIYVVNPLLQRGEVTRIEEADMKDPDASPSDLSMSQTPVVEEATDLSVRSTTVIKEEQAVSSGDSGTASPPCDQQKSAFSPLYVPATSATPVQLQMAAMTHSLAMTPYMHAAYTPSSYNADPAPPNAARYESESERKKRSRVFIDPLSEIPKLETWFIDDTHPSSYMIEKYTAELNRAPYRQRFPRLEAKNVQLWFKNHRAKVKRARMDVAAEADASTPSGDSVAKRLKLAGEALLSLPDMLKSRIQERSQPPASRSPLASPLPEEGTLVIDVSEPRPPMSVHSPRSDEDELKVDVKEAPMSKIQTSITAQ